MTMSQTPDVNRELAEVGAMFSVFDAIRRTREREHSDASLEALAAPRG